MSDVAFMGGMPDDYYYHSVFFGSKNTLRDWHLIPEQRPVIAQPEPKTNTVEIPGGQGVLDLSESLTGYPLYNNRSGSMTFKVLSDYGSGTHASWTERYQEIVNAIHGRTGIMYLEDDPDWYYDGRFKVTWNSSSDSSPDTLQIDYDLDPFKYCQEETVASVTLNGGRNGVSSGTTSVTIIPASSTTLTFPTTPYVRLDEMNITKVAVGITNPELKQEASKHFEEIGISGDTALYDNVVSNMSPTNVCQASVKYWGVPANTTQVVKIVYRRALL